MRLFFMLSGYRGQSDGLSGYQGQAGGEHSHYLSKPLLFLPFDNAQS